MPDPSHPEQSTRFSPSPVPVSREAELAAFYTAESELLRRRVGRHVVACDAVVEDACSFAWCQLVRRIEEMELGSGAFWWLYRTAVREVWRLSRDRRRQRPGGDATEVTGMARTQAQDIEEFLDDREQLRSLADVPERKRRMLMLSGMGFTYPEIARMTGDSVRTVERQLLRARAGLREARQDDLR